MLLLITNVAAIPARSEDCLDCQEELSACDLAFDGMEARYSAAERLIMEQQALLEQLRKWQ